MNPRIFMLAVGVAVGYVLGTRDGRARYDQMKAKVTQLWEDPRVVKARKDVESYAREQAPVIYARAEAAAKAAPGVAKDVAGRVSETAKDVAGQVSDTAKDVAANVSSTAKDVAGQVTDTARDVSDRVTGTAKDVADKAVTTARDAAVASATTVGAARDNLLEDAEDDDKN